jgi:hypothetical protein
MKLNIVPARTGVAWVKLGIRTFFRQPLALSGLFFLFITMMSLSSLIPFVGGALALALLPAVTLGLMAASREAETGKFPMPMVLLSAFRAGRQRLQAMLVLGAYYALGFLLVMGISALFDGGQFAKLYLVGGKITDDMLRSPDFQLAMWVALGLYMPLSLTFWHAPALVHWHGVPPLQSMFYSAVACSRNFWALTVYALVWLGVFTGVGMVVSVAGVLLGSPQSVAAIMLPVALLLAAMFFTSLYFTFRDSFDIPPGDDVLPPAP